MEQTYWTCHWQGIFNWLIDWCLTSSEKFFSYIQDEAYSKLNILRMLKFRLDRSSFEKLYLSFIRPQLEYGDVVWDPHNKFLVNILENSSNWSDEDHIGWDKINFFKGIIQRNRLIKLKDRRENHKHIQLFKMQNDITPASLSTLIPSRFQDVHTYNTRHNNALPLPRTRTSLYASYFLSSTLKIMEFYTARNKRLPIP